MVSLLEDRRRILLNTPHVEEVSDGIASFKTDVPTNLKKCVVDIDPIQDLHGYDYPWPPGGGENLLPDLQGARTTDSIYIGQTDGTTFPVHLSANTAYTVSVTVNSEAIGAQAYIKQSGGSNIKFADLLNGQGTYTPSTDMDVQMWIYAVNLTSVSKFQLEKGSIATAFSPYSNICPISGRTEIKVERCGKNLIPNTGSNLPYSANGISVTQSENSYIVTANNATGYPFTAIATMNGIKAGVYVFSCVKDNVFTGTNFSLRLVNRSVTPAVVIGNFGSIMVVSNDIDSDLKVEMAFTGARIPNGTYIISDVQLEEGSEATSYEPYTGETYDITFPTEAGTVYGGTLDMLSGVLTVDRAMVDLGTLTWSVPISANPNCFTSRNLLLLIAGREHAICSQYNIPKTSSTTNAINDAPDKTCIINKGIEPTTGNYPVGTIIIKDSDYSTLTEAEFASAMSGVQLCYELANPITYQLDPHTLKAIRGTNNIWSNSGDTTVRFWTH